MPPKKAKGKAPAYLSADTTEDEAAEDAPAAAPAPAINPAFFDLLGRYAHPMTPQEAVALAGSVGGLIDMIEIPNGRGDHHFLNPVNDVPLAARYGYHTPVDVVIARENDTLDPALQHELHTVFVPDEALMNIGHRPAGRGHWAFLTTRGENSSQARATVMLRTTDWLADDEEATAEQVWRLRQNIAYRILRGEMQDDRNITAHINIVWVAEDEDSSSGVPEPEENEPESEPDEPGPDAGDTAPGTAPGTALEHDPLNRGKNDQTGVEGERLWATTIILGEKFTVDRSRIKRGSSAGQMHKTWGISKVGGWIQYPGTAGMDWKDSKAIWALNKWRELNLSRRGFPKKRTEPRVAYTDKQKAQLRRIVENFTRDQMLKDLQQIARDFNARFSSTNPRSDGALVSATDRIRKEIGKESGKGKKTPGRKPSKPSGKKSKDDGEPDDDHESEGDDHPRRDAGPDDDDDLIL